MNGRKAFFSFMLIGLFVVLMFSSPVSADIFSKTYKSESGYAYYQNSYTTTGNSYSPYPIGIKFSNAWNNYKGLYYVGMEIDATGLSWNGGDYLNGEPFTLSYNDITYATGTMSVVKEYDSATGYFTTLRLWGYFDNFDVAKLVSDGVPETACLKLNIASYTLSKGNYQVPVWGNTVINPQESGDTAIQMYIGGYGSAYKTADFIVVTQYNNYQLDIYSDYTPNNQNEITINSHDIYMLVRGYYSNGALAFYSYDAGERSFQYFDLPLNVTSTLPDGQVVSDIIGEGLTPTSNTVSIITRVYSLADNSLIAGSKVYYRSLDGSDLVNQTLPSGTGEFHLQKGLRYEFWAEASGYENQTSIPDQAAFYADSGNEIRLTPTYGDEPEDGMGVYNFYISEQTNAAGDTTPLTSPATVTLNWQTKLTTSSGHVSFQVNKSAQVSYTIRKDGYVTVSRIYTPSWTGDTINEYISIRKEGQVLPGDPTPAATPDHRTDTQRAEAAFSIIFSNIEAFATLTCIVLLLSFIKWMKL